jgi:hypothetical protein
MHRTSIVLPATLPALVLAAVLLLPAAVRPAGATEPLPGPDPWSGYMAPPPWAYRNIPFGPYGPIGTPCPGTALHWMVRATSYAAGFMDLNPDQQKALAALEDAAKTASGRVHDACQQADRADTVPERLTRTADALDAARDEMKEVRPRYEDFYRTLAPRQKHIMDDMVLGRGPGMGRWWEDY